MHRMLFLVHILTSMKLEDLPETVWLWLDSVGGSEATIETRNLYKRMKAVLEEADAHIDATA